MHLLAATPGGLHRVTPERTVRVLDVGVRAVSGSADTVYAASEAGLFASTDGGRTWTDTRVPASDVHSVIASRGEVLAGTRPLGLFRRRDGNWTEVDGLRPLAASEGWPTPEFRDEAWARSLAHDGDRTLVGVEVGGLALRDANGGWRSVGPTEPDPAVSQRCDDVHHVAVRGPREWVLATGGGVYWTTTAGESWTRLDTGGRRYARAVHLHDGELLVGVNDSPPRWNPPNAALYAGPPDDLQPVAYPGGPERFVISVARSGDRLYAGANDGAVLRLDDRAVTQVASVPVDETTSEAYGVRSLAVVG